MCRYAAELGDVVVGRVTEVSYTVTHVSKTTNCKLSHRLAQVVATRWKLDLQSRQEATLMLSAVNLPGGVQVLECIARGGSALC